MRNSDFKDNLVNISEEADKNEKPPEPTTKPPLSPTKVSEKRF